MSADPNQWQIAAWQAGIVGAFIATVQAIFSFRRDARERRRHQIEFSHKLLDGMFKDLESGKILQLLVSDPASNENDKRLFLTAISEGPYSENSRLLPMHREILSLFYHLGRMNRAIQVGLLNYRDVENSLSIYVLGLRKYGEQVKGYCSGTNQRDALKFLRRFSR